MRGRIADNPRRSDAPPNNSVSSPSHIDSGFSSTSKVSPVISGRYGQIEWVDAEDLTVYTNRPRLFARLWAIPGVRRHQTGDTEIRAVFPAEALRQVAAVIKARRRRTLSPEEAHRLGADTAYRSTSGG